MLYARLAVGSMFRTLDVPEIEKRELVAASKLSTTVPVAEPERKVMLPVPRSIVSKKFRMTLLPTAIPVAPSKGEKLKTVGDTMSDVV